MANGIGRRQFISALGGTALAWPLAARAQQPAMPVIGFLSSRSPGESSGVVAAFRQGLREAGFVEGQNLAIAFRWAEGRYDRLPALAAELVDQRVAVLFAAGGPPAALAAKAATSSIPIVFSGASDPVRLGLVASLNRPDGNVTGMATFTADLGAKSVELLKELVPAAAVIAYLVNASSPAAEIYSKQAMTAANSLGIEVHVLYASTEQELDDAFAALAKVGANGVVVPAEPFFDSRRDMIVGLSARHAVPAIYGLREYAVAGGLMSYGTSLPESYRQAAIYVGQNSQGRKTRRPARHAANQVRTRDQPQDRQGARPQSSADRAEPSRRGDRVTDRAFIKIVARIACCIAPVSRQMSALGQFRPIECRRHVRFYPGSDLFLGSGRRCSVIAELPSGRAGALFEAAFMPSAGTTLLYVTKWRTTCRCLSFR